MFNLFKKKEKNKPNQAQPNAKISQKELDRRLANFQNNEGISTRHLDLGLWYLQQRRHFFIGVIIVLGLTSFILWGSSLYYFGSYVLNGMTSQKNALLGLTQDNLNPQRVDYIQNVKSEFLKVIAIDNNRYDLVGSITNANELMWLEFDYYFSVTGQETELEHGFVYPNENRFLFSLNQTLTGQPTTGELVIENLQWHRIDTHQIADWSEYRLEHLNFIIKDKTFIDSASSGLTENLKLNHLSFLITNQTAYGYYELPLDIVVYNQNNIVAVTHHVINNFNSRQEEQVDLSLLGYIPKATHIDIRPNINILDQSVFIPVN